MIKVKNGDVQGEAEANGKQSASKKKNKNKIKNKIKTKTKKKKKSFFIHPSQPLPSTGAVLWKTMWESC